VEKIDDDDDTFSLSLAEKFQRKGLLSTEEPKKKKLLPAPKSRVEDEDDDLFNSSKKSKGFSLWNVVETSYS